MRALRGVFVLVLALVLPAHVLAANFQAGWKAYQRGYYATAWEEWRPLAEQGDATAQYYLGVMYQNGEGVTQNYAVATLRYFQAAEQGLASAQKNLGVMYARGDRHCPKLCLCTHVAKPGSCALYTGGYSRRGGKLP